MAWSMGIAVALVVASGCTKEPTKEPAKKQAEPAAIAEEDPAPVECTLSGLDVDAFSWGETGGMRLVEPGWVEPFDRALAEWKAEHLVCRDAGWFHFAALLIRFGAETPLVADDGQSVASARAAFEAALTSPGSQFAVLEYLAYVSRVAPDDAPALPADACERLARNNPVRVAYVCGRWDEIPLAEAPYPDVGLRRVQALVAAGKKKQARALGDEARALIDRPFIVGVTEGDTEAMRQALAQSLK